MRRFPPVGGVAHEVGQGQQERRPVQDPVERQEECKPHREPSPECSGGMERDGGGIAQQEERPQRPGQVPAKRQPYPQRVRRRAQQGTGSWGSRAMAGSSSAAQTGTASPRADSWAGTETTAQRAAEPTGSRTDRKMGVTVMGAPGCEQRVNLSPV